MRVLIEKNQVSMSRRAARIIADVVRRKPNAVLGLATGSTPIGAYRALVQIAGEEGLDFSEVTTFNLDEYEGIPAGHPQSYRAFMHKHLFDDLQEFGLQEDRTYLLNGMPQNYEQECEEFEEKIRECGGVDLQLLGVGGDGHIAFAEPGSSLGGRTSLVALHPQTISDNARFFDRPDEVPRRALTMGVGTILESRACLILASGPGKADVWAKMIEGPVTSQITASALQLHPHVVALSDREAASKLQNWAYYMHVAEELADQPLFPESLFEGRQPVRRRKK